MIAFQVPILGLALLGQPSSPNASSVADGRNTADERLASMREAMKSYEFTRKDDPSAILKLQADPVFRFGKQGNLIDGAVFLFTDEAGRPEAAIQTFLERSDQLPNGKWIHEFTSLSTALLIARRDGSRRWHPAEPGLEFHPVPDAPKPADAARCEAPPDESDRRRVPRR